MNFNLFKKFLIDSGVIFKEHTPDPSKLGVLGHLTRLVSVNTISFSIGDNIALLTYSINNLTHKATYSGDILYNLKEENGHLETRGIKTFYGIILKLIQSKLNLPEAIKQLDELDSKIEELN